ncbi:MAG TPA: thioredoxin [Pyrinomonadaceae bacterium]|jgi:thioredoxin 2
MTDLIRCSKCGANNRVQAGAVQKAICGRCKTPLGAEAVKPVIVTDANFAAEVEQSPLPVLLDLWAVWCGPCRMIAPIIEQLATELAGKARVGKLDVDKNPQTAARFQARSIPLLLILKNGREVDRLIGAHPKEAILRRLQAHL